MLEIEENNPNKNQGKHPNSLANLVPGGKLGQRKRLTKGLIEATVDFLQDNREEFEERFNRLSDRDYVAAYIKMTELVTPKKTDMTIEAAPVVDWTLNVVPNPNQTAQIEQAKALSRPPKFDMITDADSIAEDVTPMD